MRKSSILIVFLLMFAILFYREYNQIINYPIVTVISISAFMVLIIFLIKTVLKVKKLNWLKGLYFIPAFFISFLFVGNLFNLVNYKYSKQHDLEYELCEITNVGCIRKHKGVYFLFKGKQKYFKYISSEIDEMCEKHNFEKYKMEVKCKQGFFNSWIIYDYDIL